MSGSHPIALDLFFVRKENIMSDDHSSNKRRNGMKCCDVLLSGTALLTALAIVLAPTRYDV